MTVASTHPDTISGRPNPFFGTDSNISDDTDDFEDHTHPSEDELVELSSRLQSVVLIDDRTLRRECLQHSLVTQRVEWDVAAYGSMDEWRAAANFHPPLAAIIFHLDGQTVTDPAVADKIRTLVGECGKTPVIVLADSDDIIQIINALDCGVRGYIPSSVSIDVCVEAINLALAGGVFVPASSVFAVRKSITQGVSSDSRLTEIFTPRQIKVADAIRQGKPNKIIAYELNMCESTVKVHIRNIMHKLKATNRTEIAYKVRDLFPNDSN